MYFYLGVKIVICKILNECAEWFPMTETDLVDALLAEWRAEEPDLPIEAMAIVGRLVLLGRHLELEAELRLQPEWRNYTDYDIVATLRRAGRPYRSTPSRLCQTIELTSGGMTAALDRLEKLGLVERLPHPEDRRSTMVQLTDAGVEVAADAARRRFAVGEEQIAVLDKGERAVLVRLLKKLTIFNTEERKAFPPCQDAPN